MNYYEEIKKYILENEINRIVKDYSKNKNDLETYYNVGKLLTEYQNETKNNNIIKECSIKLTTDIGKGYSTTNLKYMIKFYLHFKEWPEIPTQLNWSHYIELLSLKEPNEINYYIKISLEQNLSYRELHRKIINNEYYNIDSNEKNLIINNNINQYFYNISNKFSEENLKIKIEKKLIIENISSITKLLGNNFSLLTCKYKYKINNTYKYIDLLMYNIENYYYVVIKLKISNVNVEDIRHLKEQINYINRFKKTAKDNETIGFIICKIDGQLQIEYCSDNNLFKNQ